MTTNNKDIESTLLHDTIYLLQKLQGDYKAKTADDSIPDRAGSDRDLVPEANARATDGDFPGHVEHAFRSFGARLRQHAVVINRLQDDEATTRNMVLHCENLIAEAEERIRAQLVEPLKAYLRTLPAAPITPHSTQAPGTAVATDVTTQAVAEYGTATPPAEASAL